MAPLANNLEFPQLSLYGLYPAEIRGDGNCLFNALSDQMFGSQDHHAIIRADVIEYIKNNASHYKQFLEVYPGGGTRRNPKRKNAGSSTSSNASTIDLDRVFQEHISRMAKGGTWGDNMEIQAFSAAYDCNIKIYQNGLVYEVQAPGGGHKPYIHIAYHTWEHYSSVRNLDGPHHGLPSVTPKPMTPVEDDEKHAKLASTPAVAQWQIDQVARAIPLASTADITHALEQTRGNIDKAYDQLIAADDEPGQSSQQSSSVDEHDDLHLGPKKRQDRRLSRASKPYQKAKTQQRNKEIAAQLEKYGDSLESLVNATATTPIPARDRPDQKSTNASEDDEASTPDPLNDGITSSESDYGSPPHDSRSNMKTKLPMTKTDSQQSLKSSSKQHSPHKRLISSREKKDIKKQMQKHDAKERKKLASGAKQATAQPAISSIDNNSLQPTMAMRTLYI